MTRPVTKTVAIVWLVVSMACGSPPPPVVTGPVLPDPLLDSRLAQETERLLLSYGAFKQYPETTAAAIEGRLGDRASVFHAIVRATFLPLTPKRGRTIPPNTRVIDFLEAVHGIWGVRPNDSEGRHQFRMSVKFRPGLRAVLRNSNELDGGSSGPHVLAAVATGGDDDPTFQGFSVTTAAQTHRTGPQPKLQVSYLEADNTIGEIDVDFDSGLCHLTPGNSDVRAQTGPDHRHLEDFNTTYGFFTSPLTLTCELTRFHCRGSHGDANCP
jgi:hypothetical protein